MKRIYVALGILAVLVLSCTLSLRYHREQTKILMTEIDTLVETFDPENPQAAIEPTKEFLKEYDRRTAIFPTFSRHSTLTDVECELVSLPALLEKGEPLDYAAILLRCKERLYAFYRLELPLVENIL